jgi:3D (Asp-Asp-Asp) domain-containing protein
MTQVFENYQISRLLSILTLLILSLLIQKAVRQPTIISAQTIEQKEVLEEKEPLPTTSRFEVKLKTDTEIIKRETVIKDDPNAELDQDTTLEEGSDGKKTTVYKVYYYLGDEYSREVLSINTLPPTDKIISHGTKSVWRDLPTPDGTISYWRKLHVWATDYDSHCPGCDKTTATGMTQGKGVIAVDPKVIKLGSKLYIPGYGVAIAGDTGGSIKGNIIDLGFEDARTSGWHSHFIDIFLMQ